MSERVALWPVDTTSAEEIVFLSELLLSESRWFSFRPPLAWKAFGPQQWCFTAVVGARPIGFARLSYQENVESLVCSYAVHADERRKGYALQILSCLLVKAQEQNLPLLAAVLAHNEPSIALCRRFFGESLWSGADKESGRETLVFGDGVARAKFSEPEVSRV